MIADVIVIFRLGQQDPLAESPLNSGNREGNGYDRMADLRQGHGQNPGKRVQATRLPCPDGPRPSRQSRQEG
jgi:hypothetical protein